MNTPRHLKYAKTHEWVEFLDAGAARIGLTDFAQKKMGMLVFANLPAVGDELTVGEPMGDVESVKAVSDVIAPVGGTVTRVNEELLDSPGTINDDPYGAWLAEVDVTGEAAELMDADAYDAFCAQED